jgi:hypothetical protein
LLARSGWNPALLAARPSTRTAEGIAKVKKSSWNTRPLWLP